MKKTALTKLITYRIAEHENLDDYINEFIEIVSKITEIGINIPEELLSVMLLTNLPYLYENFKCAMKPRDELPSLEVIKTKILEDHESRKQNRTKDQGALLTKQFRNTNNKYGNYKDKSESNVSDYGQRRKVQCLKCGKIGHKSMECRSKRREFMPAVKTIQEWLYANEDAEKACGVQEKLNDEYW